MHGNIGHTDEWLKQLVQGAMTFYEIGNFIVFLYGSRLKSKSAKMGKSIKTFQYLIISQ